MNEKIKETLKTIGGSIMFALIVFGFAGITVVFMYLSSYLPPRTIPFEWNNMHLILIGSIIGQTLLTMFYGFMKVDFSPKNIRYNRIEKLVRKFFETKASESNLTDYAECYEALGNIKNIIEEKENE